MSIVPLEIELYDLGKRVGQDDDLFFGFIHVNQEVNFFVSSPNSFRFPWLLPDWDKQEY